jgi:hypothetical protein
MHRDLLQCRTHLRQQAASRLMRRESRFMAFRSYRAQPDKESNLGTKDQHQALGSSVTLVPGVACFQASCLTRNFSPPGEKKSAATFLWILPPFPAKLISWAQPLICRWGRTWEIVPPICRPRWRNWRWRATCWRSPLSTRPSPSIFRTAAALVSELRGRDRDRDDAARTAHSSRCASKRRWDVSACARRVRARLISTLCCSGSSSG